MVRVMACVAALFGALVLSPARPAGAVTNYTGGGFDTCAAPSVSQMSAWLGSPYRSIGIYVGGVNRACGTGNLSPSWVSTVKALGWNLVPLYVGFQAPCVSASGLATIDPAQAGPEGVLSAEDAVRQAVSLGLGAGSPIYFDMEGYGSVPSCTLAVDQFLSAWTTTLHGHGYLSGVYGSSASTIADQAAIYQNPAYAHADDIWFADWNGCPTLLDPSFFPNVYWSNSQRLHQYQANSTENWGGVTLNIDRDYDSGAVAGPGDTGSTGSPSCTPGTGWSDWARVTAPAAGIAGAPAAASWGPGRLDLFVEGGDHALYHLWSVNSGVTWSSWQALGAPPGGLAGSPAAVSWSANRIDVFARGADNALWHTWWNGAVWEPWQSLGGVLLSDPTVSSWAPGRLDVFVVGGGHVMYHTWWDGTWHNFESLGGYCLLDPGAASWGPNRIDLFTLGANNLLYHRVWNGSWGPWVQAVPGYWFSGPTVASPGVGRVDAFLESSATGQPLAHVYWAGAWYQDSEGGSLTAAPAAVASYRRLDVFVRGTDGNLWHSFTGI